VAVVLLLFSDVSGAWLPVCLSAARLARVAERAATRRWKGSQFLVTQKKGGVRIFQSK
jgi:hypothetical protein